MNSARVLKHGHIYPDNFQKQNVQRAVDIFSVELMAAIKTYKRNGIPGFFHIEETILFMEYIHKYKSRSGFSNISALFIYLYYYIDGSLFMISAIRLNTLENGYQTRNHSILLMTSALFGWKKISFHGWKTGKEIIHILVYRVSSIDNDLTVFIFYLSNLFFTIDQTFEAIIFTTKSTIESVRYLIDEVKFGYVLTRRLNSDNIERLFSSLRQSNGGNFHMEPRAAGIISNQIYR